MKRTYIKVTNKILEISSESVTFESHDGAGETFLKRIFSGMIVWKLMADGLYVEKNFATSYSLETDDEEEDTSTKYGVICEYTLRFKQARWLRRSHPPYEPELFCTFDAAAERAQEVQKIMGKPYLRYYAEVYKSLPKGI